MFLGRVHIPIYLLSHIFLLLRRPREFGPSPAGANVGVY